MPSGIQTLTPEQEKRRVIGEWRLEQRSGSANWYRVKYDEKKKSNVWLSLRESDFDKAYAKLLTLVAAKPPTKRRDPSEVKLADALVWYWENHAKNLASSQMSEIGIGYWREWWKPEQVIEDVTPVNVTQFTTFLRSKNLSEGYISRILGVGRAAMISYRDNLFVTWVPKVKDNQTQADKDEADPRGRPLSLEELARLVRHAHESHLRIFIAIMLNTVCRPAAALGLTRDQVNLEADRVKLNPEGRRQTKKWRPELPLTKSLKTVLVQVEGQMRAQAVARGEADFKMDHYVLYRGEPVEDIKTAWRTMVVNAGFVVAGDNPDTVIRDEITPYSLRHTMARVLRDARVYEEERNVYLGHKRRGGARTGAIYAPDDPKYLAEPAAVIDEFMLKLAAEVERQEQAEAQKAA